MIRLRLLVPILITIICARVFAVTERYETVVILSRTEDERPVLLQAELKALGYRSVTLFHPPKSLTPMETESILETNGGIALINITMSTTMVEIWVASRRLSGGGTLVETIDIEEGEDINPSTILKSVESLRASLMRFDNLNKRPYETEQRRVELHKHAPLQTDSDGKKEKKHRPHFSFETGLSTTYGFSQFSPPVCLFLGGALSFINRISLDIDVIIPLYHMNAENKEARAEVWYGAAALGIRAYFVSQEQRVAPWVGASVGPSLLRIKGTALGPHDPHNDTIVTGVVLLRLGLDVRLSKRVALHLTVNTGWNLAKPRIEVGYKKVMFGNPLIGGTLGVAIGLF
jgi:hypothetical protein